MSRKGFTLVEVIVILVVLSILAAVAVPVAFRIFQVTAEDTTREEMDNIKKAMIGNPQKLQSSFRSDFGFLGDIGCMPATLDQLLSAGGLPTPYTFDTTKQAGAGWKGPYITGTPGEDFTTDQWGNAYTYTVTGGPCPPASMTATLTSNGPNGAAGGGDDITVSIGAGETTATVRGKVINTSGAGLASVPVEFYSAVSGTLTTTGGTTDANGNYSFGSVPFGPRAVNANPPAILLVPASVTVSGGGNRDVNFQVANYSNTSITIDRILVNCAGLTNGGVRYDDITVDGGGDITSANNIVCNPAPAPPGTDVTDQTMAANPTPPSSLRVVVDSPDTQLPDFVLRGGSTRTISILRFETAGGATVNMSGQTFSVSFYDTAAALIATVTVVTP
ncbi:MAG: prepilin-type N-terminal cleavage/methylation domain-containing protein [Deltaproteobacteria bacterium]|nr:prepilin-type N-terminal cleavage/methylation domain-containing protein [Deltaproteobacteria bacterium]